MGCVIYLAHLGLRLRLLSVFLLISYFFDDCVFTDRMSQAKKKANVDDREQIEPVYVGEFPQLVHDEQTNFLRKSVPGQWNF